MSIFAHSEDNSFAVIGSEKQNASIWGIVCGKQTSVTGVARFVISQEDCSKVQEGDIIVTIMTVDSWLPTIRRCAGIITELGDSSCHAAECGRKYDIPVLVGAKNALDSLIDGNHIYLDCSGKCIAGAAYNTTKPDDAVSETKQIASLPVCNVNTTTSSLVNCGVNKRDVLKKTVHVDSLPTNKVNNSSSASSTLEDFNDFQEITKRIFHDHQKQFIKYVLDMQYQLSWGRMYEAGMLKAAKIKYGLDELAIACIPVSYNFFDRSEQYLESIIKHVNPIDLAKLFQRYFQKPAHVSNLNWAARVSHEEHIQAIPLPDSINRTDLIASPSNYKKIIDKKEVDPKRCHELIAAGLFLRYCIEKNILSAYI